MKKITLILAALAAVVPHAAAVAANYQGKLPLDVHTRPEAGCFYFRLEGVNVADPAISSEPWFSLRKDHPHFAELFAFLLTAKAGRLPIGVETVGAACGNPSVQVIAVN